MFATAAEPLGKVSHLGPSQFMPGSCCQLLVHDMHQQVCGHVHAGLETIMRSL
jgi:hypothetical protein